MVGDLNATLYGLDRINNGTYYMNPDANFVDCKGISDLFEPPSIGNYNTWRGGANMSVHSKIDMLFNKKESYDKFPNFSIFFANHSTSNHAPIIFNFATFFLNRRSISFKYNNSWHYKNDYHDIIQSVWGNLYVGTLYFSLSYFLRN